MLDIHGGKFAPMLAERKLPALDKLTYPLLASAKLDGIRCIAYEGVAYSRTLKPIPNQFVQSYFKQHGLHLLDGELIVGHAWAKDVYTKTSSGVMSKAGEPDFNYFAFDCLENPEASFRDRMGSVSRLLTHLQLDRVHNIIQHTCAGPEMVLEREETYLGFGYEGIMLRSIDAPYKFGRSTMKEQGMLKLKRFVDAEAKIVGLKEEMHNANEAFKDELGRTKRSSHQENKAGKGTLGAFKCVDDQGRKFDCGAGFTAEQREQYFDESYIGRTIKFKYFEPGSKDAPRHPVFLGFRDPIDA